MLASGPDGPALREERRPQPVRAVPAQVQLAVPLDAVDRSDRGAAPVTRLVHLRSPSVDKPCHSGEVRDRLPGSALRPARPQTPQDPALLPLPAASPRLRLL